MKWAVIYGSACLGSVAAILGLIWALNDFGTGGLSTHGIIALSLGVTFTVLLAVALMGLVFYSNRSKRDEQVHDADKGR